MAYQPAWVDIFSLETISEYISRSRYSTQPRPFRDVYGDRTMNRPRVLVADDNPEWRNNLAVTLSCDCDVVGFAQTGNQVPGLAHSLLPDVITLDISMPGRGGMETLSELRSTLPEVIVIMVSVQSGNLYVEEALGRGAHGYVLKNRACGELLPAIHEALRQRANAALPVA